MNLSEPKNLEDMICSLLIGGEKRTTVLLSSIRELRKNTTKQGFYASLRKLKSEDIVTVYKSNISLNTTWIKKMESIFEKININYTVKQNSFDVFKLSLSIHISTALLISSSIRVELSSIISSVKTRMRACNTFFIFLFLYVHK